MTNKQLQIYGARIKLAWFAKAQELGNVAAACRFYGIPRSEYYYWHSRWLAAGKQLTSLYNKARTPKSHPRDLSGEAVNLIVALRLETGYGEQALRATLINQSHFGLGKDLVVLGLTLVVLVYFAVNRFNRIQI